MLSGRGLVRQDFFTNSLGDMASKNIKLVKDTDIEHNILIYQRFKKSIEKVVAIQH